MTDDTSGAAHRQAKRAGASLFVGLVFAVDAIAARVKAPDAGPAPAWPMTVEWDIICRYSEAAALLHQALLNSEALRQGAQVRWAKRHEVTGRPVFDGEAAAAGLDILEHAAGWRRREEPERIQAVLDGLEVAPIVFGGHHPWGAAYGAHYFPALALSIHREDLLGLLDASGVDHDLGSAAELIPQSVKPQSKDAPASPVLPAKGRYWIQRLREHIAEIDRKHGGRATARQAIAALKRLGDPRLAVPRGQINDPDTLWYRDDSGCEHPVPRKTVQNNMMKARTWAASKSAGAPDDSN